MLLLSFQAMLPAATRQLTSWASLSMSVAGYAKVSYAVEVPVHNQERRKHRVSSNQEELQLTQIESSSERSTALALDTTLESEVSDSGHDLSCTAARPCPKRRHIIEPALGREYMDSDWLMRFQPLQRRVRPPRKSKTVSRFKTMMKCPILWCLLAIPPGCCREFQGAQLYEPEFKGPQSFERVSSTKSVQGASQYHQPLVYEPESKNLGPPTPVLDVKSKQAASQPQLYESKVYEPEFKKTLPLAPGQATESIEDETQPAESKVYEPELRKNLPLAPCQATEGIEKEGQPGQSKVYEPERRKPQILANAPNQRKLKNKPKRLAARGQPKKTPVKQKALAGLLLSSLLVNSPGLSQAQATKQVWEPDFPGQQLPNVLPNGKAQVWEPDLAKYLKSPNTSSKEGAQVWEPDRAKYPGSPSPLQNQGTEVWEPDRAKTNELNQLTPHVPAPLQKPETQVWEPDKAKNNELKSLRPLVPAQQPKTPNPVLSHLGAGLGGTLLGAAGATGYFMAPAALRWMKAQGKSRWFRKTMSACRPKQRKAIGSTTSKALEMNELCVEGSDDEGRLRNMIYAWVNAQRDTELLHGLVLKCATDKHKVMELASLKGLGLSEASPQENSGHEDSLRESLCISLEYRIIDDWMERSEKPQNQALDIVNACGISETRAFERATHSGLGLKVAYIESTKSEALIMLNRFCYIAADSVTVHWLKTKAHKALVQQLQGRCNSNVFQTLLWARGQGLWLGDRFFERAPLWAKWTAHSFCFRVKRLAGHMGIEDDSKKKQ